MSNRINMNIHIVDEAICLLLADYCWRGARWSRRRCSLKFHTIPHTNKQDTMTWKKLVPPLHQYRRKLYGIIRTESWQMKVNRQFFGNLFSNSRIEYFMRNRMQKPIGMLLYGDQLINDNHIQSTSNYWLNDSGVSVYSGYNSVLGSGTWKFETCAMGHNA